MANYPLPKFHFRVEWGGSTIGFSEVSGLNIENKLIEYRDGASLEFSKIKMPGMREFSNITLKRGVFKGNNEFHTLLNTITLNSVERRDITISLLDEKHEPTVVWKIKNAFPVKVQSTDLKADASEVAIEQIDIAHEGLVIQNG